MRKTELPNKYDTYLWVNKVIDSSKTFEQKLNCWKLINRHLKMYGDVSLTDRLVSKLHYNGKLNYIGR